jgi:hypothetical protein
MFLLQIRIGKVECTILYFEGVEKNLLKYSKNTFLTLIQLN